MRDREIIDPFSMMIKYFKTSLILLIKKCKTFIISMFTTTKVDLHQLLLVGEDYEEDTFLLLLFDTWI
jgi:hypothetical protein